MSSDKPKTPREELEASLTALLLGELPAEKAAALRDLMAKDAELAKLYGRLEQAIGLVRETTASPEEKAVAQPTLKMSGKKREQLLAHFKTVAPKEFERRKGREIRVREMAIAAGIIAFVGVAAALFFQTQATFRSASNFAHSDNSDSSTVSYSKMAKPSNVASMADQTTARLAAENALEQEQHRVVAITSSAGGSSERIGTPWQTVFNKENAKIRGEVVHSPSAGKPTANQIVLPTATDYEVNGKDQSVRLLASTNYIGQSGEPQWTGVLERGNYSAPGQSSSNAFVSRYASVVVPSNALEFGDVANLAYQPRVPIVVSNPSSTATAGFAYHSDLNRQGGFDTNGVPGFVASTSTPDAPKQLANAGISGNVVAGNDEIYRRRYGGAAWADNTRSKQGNAGLADGTAEQMSRSKLQEALRNSSDANAAEKVPAIDPATGLPIPAAAPLVAAESGVVVVSTNFIKGGDTFMRNQGVASAAVGTLAELSQRSKDASGSNIYLGAELAKADDKFGTWGLETDGDRGRVGGTKKEEESLKQMGEVVDGSRTAGRTVSGGAGFYRLGPKETPEPAVSLAFDSNGLSQSDMTKSLAQDTEKVTVLGDLPTLGKAFRGGEVKPDQTKTPADLALAKGTNATRQRDATLYYEMGQLDQAEALFKQAAKEDPNNRAARYYLGLIKDNRNRGWLNGKELVTRQAMVDIEKEWLNPTNFAGTNATQSQAGTTSNVYSLNVLGYSGPGTLSSNVWADSASRSSEKSAKPAELALNKGTEDARATYEAKKRELEDLQRFGQVLATKIASESIETSLPKTTMVEIMDPALPAQTANAGLWNRLRGKGKYESQARIKVERDQSDVSFATDATKGAQYDPNFVQNEFEAIKSDKVLGNVVAELNLQKEWAKSGRTLTTNEAIGLLKQKLELKTEPNTSFVDIGAKADKADEAAKLANAVARSYQVYRLGQRRQLTMGGIAGLDGRLKEQAAKLRETEKEVERLQAQLVIDQANRQASQTVTNQPVDVAPPKPATPALIPQPEVQTRENAFSTFSMNVSDVAFKLAAASLEKGQMPDAGSIRSEEFINAFDYRDPEAAAGVPVAFAWERARYPYAQNRDLLRFSIKTAAQGRQAGRPLNLVLLLDNSGSMERADRVAIIREALKVLASQLQPQDKLSVITFVRTAQLRVDGVAGNQAAQVAEEIGGLTPEGGTNIEEAMNLAYQTALRHYLANGINRVVLLTDGAANLGNVEPEALKQKVEANRKQGVATDCFGIGWEGFNDDLLETLSRNGDGRYGFINSPEEASTEFVGQLAGALNVAASDVKVQVEFNPKRVTAYRQIGYAKHQLTKEQFRDNTVDAAEIAAQEAGNALYVVEVNPAGEGPLGTVRVRFKVPGTSDYREHEWSVPFNGNAVALEQASPAMRLAATASAFSEWLASSPYATEVTPDTLLRYLGGVPEVYGADGRPKKLEWMIRQANSLKR